MIAADKLTEDVRQFSRAWMRAFGNQGPGPAKWAGGISVLEDNGFLPEGITSPYEYFLARENGGIPEERELFFNFIQVPEYWEIRTGNRGGGIYDMGRKKADICFAEPVEKRNVQRVEWRMDNGRTYKIDYYNKYGKHYASAFLGAAGKVESKVYYSDRHQEVIVEQPGDDTVTLLHDGRVQAVFLSGADFAEYYLKEAGKENPGAGHMLWLQDREPELLWKPGRTQSGIWDCVLFRYEEALERYRRAGGTRGRCFYGVPGENPVNGAGEEALILTASDQIAGIEYLAEECIFPAGDYEALSQAVADLAGYPGAVHETLRKQQDRKREAWESLRERLG